VVALIELIKNDIKDGENYQEGYALG
jgi:hypothetical protein